VARFDGGRRKRDGLAGKGNEAAVRLLPGNAEGPNPCIPAVIGHECACRF
jgi:hypothetical protein